MCKVAGFPYYEIEFAKSGAIHDAQSVQAAMDGLAKAEVTDLFVFSHGWNNDMNEARQLYRDFFQSVRYLFDEGKFSTAADRNIGVLGVLWPSKKYADFELISGDAASGEGDVSDEVIVNQLNRLKETLDPESAAHLDAAIEKISKIKCGPDECDAFMAHLRTALPPPDSDEETSERFFSLPGSEVLEQLEAPMDIPGSMEGAPEMGPGTGADAAGLSNMLGGVKAAALRAANYATYYVMKNRAGVVGRTGTAEAIVKIQQHLPGLRLHLIGHSFGARVVTAAASALSANLENRPRSMSLLQGAFSHNGFAKKFDGKRDGFFRDVIERQKVAGPIITTHTKNDTAVGIAYPIASRLSLTDGSTLGDENDRFGGIGRNGALPKVTPEAVPGELFDTDGSYRFSEGKIFNLEASPFVSDHGAVTGREVAAAVLSAAQIS